jgi:menaquinol-cytochrome c reductase iron-sulfur subunit
MDRRTFLAWLTNGLSGIFAVVLGVPAVCYLIDPRNRKAPESAFRTVARLSNLRVGEPYAAVVRDTRTDAWTLYPDDVIGRVWLVLQPRRQGETTDTVKAFTQICPHLGCPVGHQQNQFVCPCHHATFDNNGKRLLAGGDNPAPRDMDSLECRVVGTGPDRMVQVEYKNFFQAREEKVERK